MAEIGDWSDSTNTQSSYVRDDTLAFESAVLKEAFAAWSAAGPIPARRQFTPRSSKAFLGNLIIFEQHDATYLIRLMGTRISSVLGEMQGKLIDEAVPPDVASRWKAVLNDVLTCRKPQRAVKTVAFNDLHYLEAEIFLAPLLDAGGELTMVFAAAAFRSGVAESRKLDDLITASK